MSLVRLRFMKRAISLCQSCVRLPRNHVHFSVIARRLDMTPKIAASSDLKTMDMLDNRLNILSEYSISRKRVDEKDVRDVVKILEKDYKVSMDDATMLLRCCGKFMVRTEPSVRTEILNMLWNQLRKSGMRPVLAHYNARLLSLIENDVPFLVHEELAAMDADGIQASRLTYQLLIDRLCRDGDLFVANEIKSHMEEIGLRITNRIYNAFIRAHIEQGNFEDVTKMKDIMRDAGYQVDTYTYEAMIEGYGTRGDLEAIKSVLDEANYRGFELDANHVVEGFLNLCKNGFEKEAVELVDWIPVGSRNNQTLVNCMHRAIIYGCHEAAIVLYKKVDPVFATRTSDSIIISQISQGLSAEKVLKTLETLKEMHGASLDLDALTRIAMRFGTANQMLEYIQLMHEKGMPVWPHFFKPVLMRCGRERDIDGLFNTIKIMLQTSTDLEDAVHLITRDAQIYMEDLDMDEKITRFKNIGVPDADINVIAIYEHLLRGNVKEALERVRQQRVQLGLAALMYWASNKLDLCSDYIKVLELVSENCPRDFRQLNNVILVWISRNRNIATSTREEVLKKFISLGLLLDIPRDDFEIIEKEFRWQGISEELIEQLRKLQWHKGYTTTKEHIIQGRRYVRAPRRWPRIVSRKIPKAEERNLIQLCSAKDRTAALQVIEKLEHEGFQLSHVAMCAMGMMEADLHNLDEATKYKNILDMENVPFDYSKLVLKIVQVFLRNDRVDEALHALEEHIASRGLPNDPKIDQDIIHVIGNCARRNTFAVTRKILDIIIPGNVSGNEDPRIVNLQNHLMDFYVEKHDAEGMVDVLEYCKNKFEWLPKFTLAMKELVHQGDADNLQKVVDMAAEVMGENAVINHLVLTLVSCGKVEEARKLAQTPGLRAELDIIRSFCERHQRQKKFEEMLSDLADVTKDMAGMDGDELLFSHIRLCCSEDQLDKAVALISTYEQKGVNVSSRTLRYLANSLTLVGRDVPFEIPYQKDQRGWRRSSEALKESLIPSTIEDMEKIYPVHQIAKLMETEPELLTTYESNLISKSSLAAKSALLKLYLLKGDFKWALNVLENNGGLCRKLHLWEYLLHLRKTGQVDALEKTATFLNHAKSVVSVGNFDSAIGSTYLQLLLLSVTNNDTDEFTRFYKAAKENGAVINITPNMIELFEKNNMEFPWKEDIPQESLQKSTEAHGIR